MFSMYILQWEFDNEGVPSHMSKQDLEDSGVKVQIQENGQDQPTEIKHLDCNEAHRTLRVYKTIKKNKRNKLVRKARQSPGQ
jgi:hypothetical protein